MPGERPSTYLLDEILELRTFESFPGLRHVLRETIEALAASGNRFVLTSRYVARALRLLRDAGPRFEVIHLPSLSPAEVTAMLPPMGEMPAEDREFLGRTVQALTDGRAAYVRAVGEAAAAMSTRGGDPISALTALLTADGALTGWCGYRYELRLHRARGYGALKAILEILAEDEPLTLTEIAQRLQRTPGSTKDYLSWLEDVDLDRRAAEALQLRRPAAPAVGAPPLPARAAVGRRSRARGAGLCAASGCPKPRPATVARLAGDRRAVGIIEID